MSVETFGKGTDTIGMNVNAPVTHDMGMADKASSATKYQGYFSADAPVDANQDRSGMSYPAMKGQHNLGGAI